MSLLLGHVTKKGFEVKRQRSMDMYSTDASTQASDHSATMLTTSTSGVEISKKLKSSELIHSTLSKLFNKSKKTNKGTAKVISVELQKKKKSKAKLITVLLIPTNTNVISRNFKQKLRESGFMKSMNISEDDNEAEIDQKIVSCFPMHTKNGYKFHTATKSGDLFPAMLSPDHATWNGAAVLDLVGNGCLMISSTDFVTTTATGTTNSATYFTTNNSTGPIYVTSILQKQSILLQIILLVQPHLLTVLQKKSILLPIILLVLLLELHVAQIL